MTHCGTSSASCASAAASSAAINGAVVAMMAANSEKTLDEHYYTWAGFVGRFKDGKVVQPRDGASSWLADCFGFFRKVHEARSIQEFLGVLGHVMVPLGFRDVIRIEVDEREIYDDENSRDIDDFARAGERLAKDQKAKARKDIESVKLFVSFMGRVHDLDVVVEVTYYRIHREKKPAIEVDIEGIPVELSQAEGESDARFEQRMKDLVEKFEHADWEAERFRHVARERTLVVTRELMNKFLIVFRTLDALDNYGASDTLD